MADRHFLLTVDRFSVYRQIREIWRRIPPFDNTEFAGGAAEAEGGGEEAADRGEGEREGLLQGEDEERNPDRGRGVFKFRNKNEVKLREITQSKSNLKAGST